MHQTCMRSTIEQILKFELSDNIVDEALVHVERVARTLADVLVVRAVADHTIFKVPRDL